jgi:hypothetical protein
MGRFGVSEGQTMDVGIVVGLTAVFIAAGGTVALVFRRISERNKRA